MLALSLVALSQFADHAGGRARGLRARLAAGGEPLRFDLRLVECDFGLAMDELGVGSEEQTSFVDQPEGGVGYLLSLSEAGHSLARGFIVWFMVIRGFVSMSTHPAFHRAELLLGQEALASLREARVIIFGVGGVGSWCAEALVRSGVGHLTLVDNDVICVTNVNRQLQATMKNVGSSKVDALRDRLLEIYPEADVCAKQVAYNKETRDTFDLSSYDYIVDAIDSLSHKVNLIACAMEAGVTLYSAMGAACKLDPTAIRVASIWDTSGCKLARFVRKRLRRRDVTGDCLCVYSEEFLPSVEGTAPACGSENCFCPKQVDEDGEEIPTDVWCHSKAQINGSMVHITGIYGFHLAGLIIQDIYRKAAKP